MKYINNNLFKKIANIVLDFLVFIFSIILIISIYSGIQTKIIGNDYANFFGYSVFEVQTGSMFPTIKAGDWIIVKLTNNVYLNDIITYKYNDEYITHRVIESYRDTYITQGDANNAKDSAINKKQIIGKVVKIVGGIGIIKKVLFNPQVMATLGITILICVFAFKKRGNTSSAETKTTNNAIDNVVKKIKEFIKTRKNDDKTLDAIFEDDNNSHNSNLSLKTMKDEKIEVLEAPDDKDYTDKEVKFEQISGNHVSSLNDYTIDNLSDDDIEKELDKTLIYREILVDKSEINNTLREIASNQVDNDFQLDKTISIKEESPEGVILNDNTKIDLTALDARKGRHHSKNIIDKIVNVKIEEIEEIITCLTFEEDKEVNEATIMNKLIDSYINAKYYNNYTDVDTLINSSDKNVKLTKFIKNYGKKLSNSYQGPDTKFGEKVLKYTNLMLIMAVLDDAAASIDENKVKLEFYKDKIGEYIEGLHITFLKPEELASKIIKIQRNYDSIISYLLKKLETNVFNLEFNALETRKNIYALKLNHNLSFNRLYSDYIVDKTYNEGIIAEDKLNVLLNLLGSQIVKDMLTGDFNRNYILYIPDSLYSKKRKFESLLEAFENEYVRNHVIVLINAGSYISNHTFINKLRKQGYRFTLFLNENDCDKMDYKELYSFDYIFVLNRKASFIKNITIKYSELSSRFIDENIVSMVGDFEVNDL